MSKSTRLRAVAVSLLAGAVLTAVPAVAHGTTAAHRGGAVFVETDGPHNAVVVYRRGEDGSLRPDGTYPTGGAGGALAGSVVDHTASQGAVTYDAARHLLYAVNAGSDTVTVFAVHGDRLTRLQVVPSGGAFPVSVAVHGHFGYVLNARNGGSVQGFASVGGRLVSVPGWRRSLGLDPAATPEFTTTPGQVEVSPDGRHLLVTTKGNTNAVDVFALGRSGTPASTPEVTAIPGAAPFALTFDRAGHAVVAEAGPSDVATFTLRGNGSLAPIRTVATGEAATCWVTAAGAFVYAGNAGGSTVSGYRVSADGDLTSVGTTPAGTGTVDVVASPDGRYLYVRSGGDGTLLAFRIGADGSLSPRGAVPVPDGVGGEGIAVS